MADCPLLQASNVIVFIPFSHEEQVPGFAGQPQLVADLPTLGPARFQAQNHKVVACLGRNSEAGRIIHGVRHGKTEPRPSDVEHLTDPGVAIDDKDSASCHEVSLNGSVRIVTVMLRRRHALR
jgi:hypothetical protein